MVCRRIVKYSDEKMAFLLNYFKKYDIIDRGNNAKQIYREQTNDMKLNIDRKDLSQPDPYVISDGGRYYMYSTGADGIQLYISDNMIDWKYSGLCRKSEREKEYWAPSVIKYGSLFYMYYSSMEKDEVDVHKEQIRVAVCDRPDGEFILLGNLTVPFSIDPHVIKNSEGLYIIYSINDYQAERAGTLIVIDKMISPTQTANDPKVAVRATLDEEIFMRDRFFKGQHWHTIEGGFYFRDGNYHYIMYSGNCYMNENYFIGYSVAYGDTDDLTSLTFRKYPDENTYCPFKRKGNGEEGTGHNSVLIENGHYYMFYHARVAGAPASDDDTRRAYMAEIKPENGILKSV